MVKESLFDTVYRSNRTSLSGIYKLFRDIQK